MKTPTQIKKEMGARLQDARVKAGFATAETFCEKFNIPLEHFLDHESGKVGIKASEAIKYCRLLSIPINWLILG